MDTAGQDEMEGGRPIRSVLRQRTRHLHSAIERTAYSELLTGHGLTAAHVGDHLVSLGSVWREVERRSTTSLAAVWQRGMSRTSLFDADLAGLVGRGARGFSADAARPACQWWRTHGATPRALGFLYVLEGSVLGGQVLVSHMRRQGFGDCTQSLQPYGSRAGYQVRQFCMRLDRADAPLEAVVEGALAGFRTLTVVFDAPARVEA